MQIDEEQFIDWVRKAELEAKENLAAYKTKLGLFAVFGYFVILVILTLLLSLVGGTIAIAFVSTSLLVLLIKKKIIFAILFAIWVFLRALWVKFEAPQGYELDREKFPQLFTEIDVLTKTLDALKIHKVIMDEEFNASVYQHPRLGVLGFHQNYLTIGLELMLSLSPQEMRAVLAHEFGHLSGNHSRFSGWIYRIRKTWYQVMQRFDNTNSFGAGIMRLFFDWYAPKFSAYSFALARINEYEADSISAKLTSSDTATQALVNLHVRAPYVDETFWQSFFEKADILPEPPHRPFEGLASFIKTSPIERKELLERIKSELEIKTHYADTHPALSDRIKAIDYNDMMPQNLQVSAAESWLGEHFNEVLDHFDERWIAANKEKWQQRFHYVTNAKKFLKEHENKKSEELDDEQLWQFATDTNEFNGSEKALPFFRTFQKRYPDSVGAAYYIGKILASNDDEEALKHLRIALNNENTIVDAAQWGYQLLCNKGKNEQAEQWWDDALEIDEARKAVEAERNILSEEDDYESPKINDALLKKIKRTIADQGMVGQTWLAQKVLKLSSDPIYILAYKPKLKWNTIYLTFEKIDSKVIDAFNIEADIFIVNFKKEDTRKLAKKVKKVGIKII